MGHDCAASILTNMNVFQTWKIRKSEISIASGHAVFCAQIFSVKFFVRDAGRILRHRRDCALSKSIFHRAKAIVASRGVRQVRSPLFFILGRQARIDVNRVAAQWNREIFEAEIPMELASRALE